VQAVANRTGVWTWSYLLNQKIKKLEE